MNTKTDPFTIAGWLGFPLIMACFAVKQKWLKFVLLACQFTIGFPLIFITAIPFIIFSLGFFIYSMIDDINSGRA